MSSEDHIEQPKLTGAKQCKKTVKKNLMRQSKITIASLLALGICGGSAQAADFAALENGTATVDDHYLSIAEPARKPSVPEVGFIQEKTPNKWLIGAALGLILAALAKLVGANRVLNMFSQAGPTIKMAAEKIAAAPKAAAQMIGSSLMSPLHFLIIVGGIAMIGFTGINLLDLNWGAGMIAGIGMSALSWVGAKGVMRNLKSKMVFAKAKTSKPPYN